MKLRSACIVISLILCTEIPGFTETVHADSIFSVDNAISDSYHRGSHFHALWMPGLERRVGPHFVFQNPGTFRTTGNTATLTGTVVHSNNTNRGWNIQVNFSGLTNTAPPGSPKKELKRNAYIERGGPVDTSTWSFYTNFSGTLTGTGLYSGASVSLYRFGPAFQFGDGASGKNIELGASGWFSWAVTRQPLQGPTLHSRFNHGDFNLNMAKTQTTATPEPSTIILLGSGLAGFLAWRRKKK